MTWDQFLALALGLIATALVRLLDKYLPPSQPHPALEAAVAEPMAGPPRPMTAPSSDELPEPDSEPTTGAPGPPEGYEPPRPG